MEDYFRVPYKIGTYLIHKKTRELAIVHSYILNDLGLEIKMFINLDKEYPTLRDGMPINELLSNWEECSKEERLKR